MHCVWSKENRLSAPRKAGVVVVLGSIVYPAAVRAGEISKERGVNQPTNATGWLSNGFRDKYKNNPDPHNRDLAFQKMLKEIMLMRRKDELELYKLFANDSAFKSAWTQSMQHAVSDMGQGILQVA